MRQHPSARTGRHGKSGHFRKHPSRLRIGLRKPITNRNTVIVSANDHFELRVACVREGQTALAAGHTVVASFAVRSAVTLVDGPGLPDSHQLERVGERLVVPPDTERRFVQYRCAVARHSPRQPPRFVECDGQNVAACPAKRPSIPRETRGPNSARQGAKTTVSMGGSIPSAMTRCNRKPVYFTGKGCY